jgi:hypothetical protein
LSPLTARLPEVRIVQMPFLTLYIKPSSVLPLVTDSESMASDSSPVRAASDAVRKAARLSRTENLGPML